MSSRSTADVPNLQRRSGSYYSVSVTLYGEKESSHYRVNDEIGLTDES